MFSTIHNSQDMEMSIDRWMDKENMVQWNFTQPQKRSNSIFNTDRPRDYHTKWSKSERQILYDITYMWNLKYETDKERKKESDVAQSCLTLCNPMDCSLPGLSIHGVLQARILEWVTISFSRGSSWSRDQNQVSRIGWRRFNLWATREALTQMNLSTKQK